MWLNHTLLWCYKHTLIPLPCRDTPKYFLRLCGCLDLISNQLVFHYNRDLRAKSTVCWMVSGVLGELIMRSRLTRVLELKIKIWVWKKELKWNPPHPPTSWLAELCQSSSCPPNGTVWIAKCNHTLCIHPGTTGHRVPARTWAVLIYQLSFITSFIFNGSRAFSVSDCGFSHLLTCFQMFPTSSQSVTWWHLYP